MESIIHEACLYVGFTPEDLTRLRSILPAIEARLPVMADTFYKWLLENPRAAQVLREGPEQIERLKKTLVLWARGVMIDERDERYAISRNRIGAKHVQLGLENRYVMGAFSIVRIFLAREIRSLGRKDADLYLESLDRALDLDLNLVSNAYTFRQEEDRDSRRAEEYDAFNRIQYCLLKGSHNLRDLEPIRSEIARVISVDLLFIALNRPTMSAVEVLGVSRVPPGSTLMPGVFLSPEGQPFRDVLVSGKEIQLSLDAPPTALLGDLARDGLMRLLFFPLWVEHRILGLLCCGRKEAGPVSESLEHMFRSVADAVAMAVAQAEVTGDLARSENRFRTLFSSVSDAIYTVDSEQRLVSCNPVCARLLALGPHHEGASLESVLEAAGGRGLLEAQSRVFEDGQPRTVETLVTVGGVKRSISWSLMTLAGAEDGLRTLTAVGRDVTQERRDSALTAHRHKMAALGLLASGIAHEVANPLAAIATMAQEIEETITDAHSQDLLRRIGVQTQRAARTLRQMLEYARPAEAGTSGTDVKKVLESTAEVASFDRRAQHVQVRLDIPDDVAQLSISPDRLSQVFMNLLFNAFDALGEEGGLIQVASRSRGNTLEISVTDDGPGISQEVVGRIFDPFFTTKEGGRGTGLGLYMCQQVLGEEGGRLDVRTSVGEGTTFTIVLPMREKPAMP